MKVSSWLTRHAVTVNYCVAWELQSWKDIMADETLGM